MDIKYNPFGDSTNTYQPDYSTSHQSKDSATNWVSIVSMVVVSMIVVAYAITFFIVSSQKSDVEKNIIEFNDSLASLHETMIDSDVQKEIIESGESMFEKYGNEEARKASRLMVTISKKVSDDDKPIYNKSGTDENEASMVAPYYAYCDFAEVAADGGVYDIKRMCSSFSSKAREMMYSVRSYNNISDSWVGTITMHTNKYADILKDNIEEE